MKKLVFCFVFLLCSFYIFAQNIGDKVYKENGRMAGRWLQLRSIYECEYDKKGNEIHRKVKKLYDSFGNEEDVFFEYDEKGNVVYEKTIYSKKSTYKYDKNGKLIYEKYDNGEVYFQYDYDRNLFIVISDTTYEYPLNEYDGIINSIFHKYKNLDKDKYLCEYDQYGNIISTTDLRFYEKWYEYDKDGKCVYEEAGWDGDRDSEFRFKYNSKGELIYWVYNNDEHFYEYDKKTKMWYGKNVEGEITVTEKRKKIGKEERVVYIKYSSDGECYEYEYDSKGNKTHGKRYNEKSELKSEFWYEYDSKGNLLYSHGIIYEYEFYPDGKVKVCREWIEF